MPPTLPACEICQESKPGVADYHGIAACPECVRGRAWESLRPREAPRKGSQLGLFDPQRDLFGGRP